MKNAKERAEAWLQGPYDEATQAETQRLIKEGGDALLDAFYQDLDFGTGGLRGIMGVGTNRVNKYTLGAATQGLANYLNAQFPNEQIKVAIAYDSRHNSKSFSRQVAEVLSANGIKVFLYEELRPTPALSFAIRHLNCQSGIVLTASHNPPAYNGYKVYWSDGGQLVPPHDKGVISEVRAVKADEVRYDFKEDLIEIIGDAVDQAYLAEVQKLSLTTEGKKDLAVVFTSIHGTSITLVPPAMKNAGFEKLSIVEEQAKPDGDFPTVVSPNPEESEALSMALAQAERENADMVIGTDPDADRVGIAVRNLEGELELLNGNQAASVLIDYLLSQWQKAGKFTGKEYVAKTIVTTDLIAKIAEGYNVACPECLTGFKWIADIIRKHEGEYTFIGGGEESYGYMIGEFVRDKDAVASAMMLAEAAAYAKSQGSSFYESLVQVYVKFGFYLETLVSLKREGIKGQAEIAQMMEDFRHKTPESIAGERIVKVLDYQSSESKEVASGAITAIDLPKSNVVQFVTDKGTKITARPSGTEPKIKFYVSVNDKLASADAFKEKKAELEARLASITQELGL
ncbi:MAG: phosphoglucomutase [Bacteroidetes bacterium]|nr:MAG: phosphoglucomutase [Bacteroidota bacterium]